MQVNTCIRNPELITIQCMAKLINDSEVFAAAIDTLLARGYAGATTKLIAQRAGINEVTLFRKYGTKVQLVVAAVAHERMQLEEHALEYTGDIAADLLKIVGVYQGASPRQSQLLLFIMGEMVRYPELRETLQVPFRLVSKFSQLIVRYQQEGDLKAGEPLLIVGAFLGPVMLNTMLRSADPDLPVPPLDLAVHVNRFLDGYAT